MQSYMLCGKAKHIIHYLSFMSKEPCLLF